MDEHFRPFSSFWPMFEPERHLYISLPGGLRTEHLQVTSECLAASADPESEMVAMLEHGWREQMVAGVAMLAGFKTEKTLEAMWEALDADSWTAPQLVVLLSVLDSDAISKMKKRILLGCPVTLRGQEKMSAMERHIHHGSAAVRSYSKKAWSAICWRLFLTESEWLLQRFGADEVWQRLLEPYGYEGADIANSWHRQLRELLPDLNLPPALEKKSAPTNVLIARHWRTPEKEGTYQCPVETVEVLLRGKYNPAALIRPFLKPGTEAGDRVFDFTAEGVNSAHSRVPITPGMREVVLSYVRLDWGSDVGVMRLAEEGPDLWLVRVGAHLRMRLRTPVRKLEGRIDLTRDRLEQANTDAICYGAKDTGEMGGGAAMAVYQSCGPEVLEAAREALAQTTRQIGEVVYTPAYGHDCTVFVGHLISIKTGTSQGDWCPEPERLGAGVYKALQTLPQRARTLAFSCLATGEGRADPDEIARLMIGATRRFFRDFPDSPVQVLFSLPDHVDYEAFQRAIQS